MIITQDEHESFYVNTYEKDNLEGFILEVDLEDPRELHNVHKNYPPGPEKIKIKESMLSNCCKETANKHNVSIFGVKKPVHGLGCKDKYVLHYQNFQLYLQLARRLEKIIEI